MTEEKKPVKKWLKSLVLHGNTVTLTIPALARRALGLHSYSQFQLELYEDHLEIWTVELVRRQGRFQLDQVIESPKRHWRKGTLSPAPQRGGIPLADVDNSHPKRTALSNGGKGPEN